MANQKFQSRQRIKGLCLDCKNVPSQGRTRCDACMEKRRLWEQNRRKQAQTLKLCEHCCKRPRLKKHRLCERCYLADVSVRHFGTTQYAEFLKDKFDQQNGRCALSGRPITLGMNSDLDHVIPKSKGGNEDRDNVRWVLRDVSHMKYNMSDSSFVSLIADICLTLGLK